MSAPLLPPVPASVSEALVEVGDGIILRVLRAGHGPALLLVPGWTCTADFFVHQLTGLAEHFDVIAIDPRGHGGSSKPLTGNTFTQRGADLAALIDALALDEVILGGWSFGVLDALAYLRDFGTAAVSKLLLVDETPRVPAMPGVTEEWGEAELSHDGIVAVLQAMINTRETFWAEYAVYMLGLPDDTPLDHPDVVRVVELGMRAPEHVAVATGADGLSSNFADTAASASAAIPTLFIARDDWADAADRWVTTNMPDAIFATMPTHMGFATDPESFNRTVRDWALR